jgi:hypothetical protein
MAFGRGGTMKYDVFISHASEDKDRVARPLAAALRQAEIRVWYDEFTLQIGDSLSESIDFGLAGSRYGVVIISKQFLKKAWTKRELRGLVSREIASRGRVLLPVWHEVSKEEVLAVSPPLADVLAVSTSRGLGHVARKILEVVRPRRLSRHESKGRLDSKGRIDSKGGPGKLRKSAGPLDGEYVVWGWNPDGTQYTGRSTIREHEGVLVIASKIGSVTYICQGKRRGKNVSVYGDFKVRYFVNNDGSLDGSWGNGATETLTPIDELDHFRGNVPRMMRRASRNKKL